MSKRGRRRNSKRRKSSCSSKQSISPYIFQKQNNSNNDSYKENIVEKGETDSFRKENALSGSEDEERYNNDPPEEKKCNRGYYVNSSPKQRTIFTKTTQDKGKGIKIVTSMSVSDMEDSSFKIVLQSSHEPLSENQTHSSTPLTNIMKIVCSEFPLKCEIQEILDLNTCGVKTTIAFMNEGGCAEMHSNGKCETGMIPNGEPSEQPSQRVSSPEENKKSEYKFTSGSMSGQTETSDSKSVSPMTMWDSPYSSQYSSDHKTSSYFMLGNHPLLNMEPQRTRIYFHNISADQFWDIPPPQEFADITFDTFEDLTHNLASCRISPADEGEKELHLTTALTSKEESRCPFSKEVGERADLSLVFDQLSECDNFESMLLSPSLSTNRNILTEDIVNFQKRKSWITNNIIHSTCLPPKKRRHTFPGTKEGTGLMQEDLLLSNDACFSSFLWSSIPLQMEGLENICHSNDQCSAYDKGNYSCSQRKGLSKPFSEISHSQHGKQSLLSTLYSMSSENNPDMVSDSKHRGRQSSCRQQEKDTDDYEYKLDPSEVADRRFDQDMSEVEYHRLKSLAEELGQRPLAIQVIPPSSSDLKEQMLQDHTVRIFENKTVKSQEHLVSVLPKHSKSSLMTINSIALEQSLLQGGSKSSLASENHISSAFEDPCISSSQDVHAHSLNRNEIKKKIEETNEPKLDTGRGATDDLDKPAVRVSCPGKGLTLKKNPSKEELSTTDKADKHNVSRSPFDTTEHLKPMVYKEPDCCGSDHWAKRRKIFKESKQWSSAGGSSITSDITEESVSEDTHSLDMTFRENEDRGFYTETFHSSAWIYQGSDVCSGAIPPSPNNRTRAVSIRERTVKIIKGTGEYPWGFRIQFSKPIVVTEVDTNGAAEEAGLMVGDYVLAVNGTDVTSIPHSEAANLARQGPDLLTLTIGSDIARCPNTPRPACRGYLHKRTQSGLIKSWRKRWFVLSHECCLYYYKHKRDEGKRQAMSAVKLEGAEVGPDVSLGKPFVFKCRPQSYNRVFFFCATSNQEMKRWLEAMERAILPITQIHVWEDVTKHNSSLPPLAVKDPECLGLLHKMDINKNLWVQHYCILKDGCLSLYSGIRATHAQGGIYLQGYMVREQPYGSKKSTIELKPPSDEFKTFYFCAENPNENKRWIIAIKASIKKWLPLHQALQNYMNQPREETRM